jgi:8-oxo-dGTP pyrophosphatase MutT (NUDIX family)
MTPQNLTKPAIEHYCNCAGVFLIKDVNSVLQILLVETKRKQYQYSFPKGKRNKGEDTLTCAKRELKEETGITEDQYKLFPNKYHVEHSTDTNLPHIVYYLAVLTDHNTILAPEDTREVVSAEWFTPEHIYTMRKQFYLQRRQIVTRAVRDYKRFLAIQFDDDEVYTSDKVNLYCNK